MAAPAAVDVASVSIRKRLLETETIDTQKQQNLGDNISKAANLPSLWGQAKSDSRTEAVAIDVDDSPDAEDDITPAQPDCPSSAWDWIEQLGGDEKVIEQKISEELSSQKFDEIQVDEPLPSERERLLNEAGWA